MSRALYVDPHVLAAGELKLDELKLDPRLLGLPADEGPIILAPARPAEPATITTTKERAASWLMSDDILRRVGIRRVPNVAVLGIGVLALGGAYLLTRK